MMISDKQSTVLGITLSHSVALQITVPATLASHPLIYLDKNGVVFMNHKVENEESSAVRQAKNKLKETVDEIATEISEQIHAVKSSLENHKFCNLSEVVVRPEDTADDLRRKVRIATILGTLQATLTNFRYLRGIWKTNTEEESLLGVSLTGILDNPLLTLENDDLDLLLQDLRDVAVETTKSGQRD